MIGVEDAQALCLGLVTPIPTLDMVPLALAAGRVMRREARADRAQPPFESSAMDGYALRDAELAIGASFDVVGESGPVVVDKQNAHGNGPFKVWF